MSVSIAILKVLSSHKDGRASHASLKADLAMLGTREWLARMSVLRRRAGPINIFSREIVTRDDYGWTITQAGRELLDRLEQSEEIQRPEAPTKPQLRLVYAKAAIVHQRFKALPKLVRLA
jgi:hypothetical protein